jgi:hypothetical protein
LTTLWGWLKTFGRFWYDFVVGDDWTIAAGVLAALGATYGILRAAMPAWWLLPLAGAAIGTYAVIRANRAAAATEPDSDAADEPSHRERHENEPQQRSEPVPDEENAVG